MEKSLVILKPACMEKCQAGLVVGLFEQAGFEIVACKMMRLTPDLLRVHYAHVADLPFYPEIEAFMSSRPVLVMILAGEGVIDRVRELLGPTDSKAAAAGPPALVLFFPANIFAAINQVPMGGHTWGPVYLFIRAPLQIIILFWVYWFTMRRSETAAKPDGR